VSATTPQTVAHYTLLDALEPAGPGELYRARDTRLGRTVVVRRMPPEVNPGGIPRDAFVRGVRALTGFSHQNVTAVFDAGIAEQHVYVVFEFLNGHSLRTEMGGRPIGVRAAVEFAIQIAEAVAAVHAAGYGHSGLSPDAIVVTAKGRSKIPAFALASRTGFADPTGTQLIDYASPEEAQGGSGDERSDVFSAGAVLYELLTGRRPSPKGAAAPSSTNPQVPSALDSVVLNAIAPNPDRRCASAATLASELRRVLQALDTADEPKPKGFGLRRLLGW
jgi:serine/threonine-protein kinase